MTYLPLFGFSKMLQAPGRFVEQQLHPWFIGVTQGAWQRSSSRYTSATCPCLHENSFFEANDAKHRKKPSTSSQHAQREPGPSTILRLLSACICLARLLSSFLRCRFVHNLFFDDIIHDLHSCAASGIRLSIYYDSSMRRP